MVVIISCENKKLQADYSLKGVDTLSKVEDSCQILYHGNFSYQLCCPKDLTAQGDSALIGAGSSRVLVKYYPKQAEKSFMIYSNLIFKHEFDGISTTDFVKGEISAAKNRGEKVFSSDTVFLREQKKAIIRHFFVDEKHQYFSIAYIDEPKEIVMVSYSAETLNVFKKNYLYFEQIVNSYEALNLIPQ